MRIGNDKWRISIQPHAIYVTLCFARPGKDALGFVVKRKSRRLFSERAGGIWKSEIALGPLYFRTFARVNGVRA